MKNHYILLLSCLMLLFLSLSCRFNGGEEPTLLSTSEIHTSVAQTMVAAVTATAEAAPNLLPSPTEAIPTTDNPPSQTPEPTVTIEPTQTLEPSPTPKPSISPSPTATLEIIYHDPFTLGETWWYEISDEDFGFELTQENNYRVYVNILNARVWSVREMEYSDIHLEVDVSLISGAEDGYFGLFCRFIDEDNYYALVIGVNGYGGILKVTDGEFEELTSVSQSVDILPAGEINRVQAECVGNKLSVFANDHLLVEIQDDDHLSGEVGLLVGTRLSGPIEVIFDNFTIYKPRGTQ
jgi:hypothetical protein